MSKKSIDVSRASVMAVAATLAAVLITASCQQYAEAKNERATKTYDELRQELAFAEALVSAKLREADSINPRFVRAMQAHDTAMLDSLQRRAKELPAETEQVRGELIRAEQALNRFMGK